MSGRAVLNLVSITVVSGLAGSACVLLTDAATRLGEDVVETAGALRQGPAAERTLVHEPRSWPSGCQAGYTVTFQESLHHPRTGGALLVGCKGESNFKALGYSYSTTYHLNAVRVPIELSVEKNAGTAVRVTLRKGPNDIDVVTLE